MEISNVKGIIYGITCDKTNKTYVGQTMSHQFNKGKWIEFGMKKRYIGHLNMIDKFCSSYPLYEDLKKYEMDDFKIFQIDECAANEIHLLDQKETDAILKYNASVPNGYNTLVTGVHLGKSKKLIMEHFNLKPRRSDDYENRQKRSNQKTIQGAHLRKKIEFFKDKEITHVEINPIKTLGKITRIRVLFTIKDHKNKYRVDYTSDDVKISLAKAIELLDALNVPYFLDPHLKNLDSKDEVYRDQKRLDSFKDLTIKNISGNSHHNISNGANCYLLLIYPTVGKLRRVMFGGKHDSIEDSYKRAKEFVDKLKELQDIQKIDLHFN